MRGRAVVLAIGALVAVCSAAAGAGAGSVAPSPSRLVAFDGCRSFASYMRKHAVELVGRNGIGAVTREGGTAPGNVPSAPAFSATNVQEEGVDEPDAVKTDGRTLFVTGSGRISAVDVRSGRPTVVDTLRLDKGTTYELLLRGDHLLALSRRSVVPVTRTGPISPIFPLPLKSSVTEIDVASPARMRVVRTMELDGGYLTARLVGSTARIVVASSPITEFPLLPANGVGTATQPGRIRDLIRSASAASLLPRYTVRNAHGAVTRKGPLVGCRDVLRPRPFSGLGLVTVLTVDLERGLKPIDSDALAADARTVYASPSSLYLATSEARAVTPRGGVTLAGTAIHKFDISSPDETRYRASGRVPGVLLDQWSLSERDGILRVASTSVPLQTGGAATESETSVTTFADRGSSLVPLGQTGGLGRGERVQAVRFVGDAGYVVTFKQVDPLFTVGLSNPARPVVRGKLELRGYSAYLHPLGDGRLLGIGQDATEEGRTVGTLASLFDVSDPSHPRRLDSLTLGQTRSQAEEDHHAFLWWPRTRLAVIPIQTYLDRPFVGALGLRIGRSQISEAARLVHPGRPGIEPVGSPGSPIVRSLVVGDTLYTVSATGVKASALGTLTDRGFAKLPLDPPGKPPQPTPPPPRRP
jgi:uncharacterized secreted protein with C-terminal beta-propeller domain